MALSSVNPLYSAFLPLWDKLRDCYAGEETIKAAGTTYLPATMGMELDGMGTGQPGLASYERYKKRAVYPPFVEEAVQAMIGVMWHKPPVIELPSALEPLRAKATADNEGLDLLLRRINEAQLTSGRIGLLLDLMDKAPLPHIATYHEKSIINWDDGAFENPAVQSLNLVVLDEKEFERTTDFEWVEVQKYRVLVLGDPFANEPMANYRQALFRETETFNPDALKEPSIRGNTLQEIPFVFINSTDLLPSPVIPPLLKLANVCLTIYRGEADHRQNLHQQAQDTLVVIGGEEGKVYRLGAGGGINLPLQGDAKFIGVNSAGLPEQRSTLETDRAQAKEMSGRMLDAASRAKESGEALHIRVAAQTATLNQVAITGAAGLEFILKIAAKWIGANPEQVSVQPNLEFADDSMTVDEFLKLTDAKAKGFPLSEQSLHALAVENELTDKTFEEELELLAKERADALDLSLEEMEARQDIEQKGQPEEKPMVQ